MAPTHAALPIHAAARPAELSTSGNGLDLLLAIGLLAGGVLAFVLNKTGGMLAPNVEGGLTTSVLSVALCKAARLNYRTTVATVTAIVLIELGAGLAAGVRAVEIIAYPLVALGLLGLLERSSTLRKASPQRDAGRKSSTISYPPWHSMSRRATADVSRRSPDIAR